MFSFDLFFEGKHDKQNFMPIEIKICSKCKLPKHISNFGKDTKRKDKFYPQCKKCRHEYNTSEHGRTIAKKGNQKFKSKPEYKKYKKEYDNQPHIKKQKIAQSKQYCQRPEIKKKLKKYNNEYQKEYRKTKKWQKYQKQYAYQYTRTEESKVYQRRYKRKKYKDPMFRLNDCIAVGIRQSLKGNKNGRHWENIVGYTLNDLKEHLEKQFESNMTWNNYGHNGWTIDHIIPKSKFNFTKSNHEDFKRCWALKNLRPLWASDNFKKKDKLLKPFQPRLAL